MDAAKELDNTTKSGKESHFEESLSLFKDEPLYQEVEPKEAKQHGGLRKTKELKADSGNYYAVDTKGFTINATEIVHINGWEDGVNSEPLTLLVVKISVHSTERGFKFLSVTVRFTFEGGDHSRPFGPAAPTLVAYAPFSSTVRWEVSEEERKRILSASGTVGVNYGANVSVTGGGQWEVSKKKKFFAKGNASLLASRVDDERINGVKWYMESNPSQGEEVAPEFMVAVLIQRATKTDSFTGDFRLRAEGGTASEIQAGLRRFLGIDPRRTLKAFQAAEQTRTKLEGESLLKACAIDKDKLGSLRKDDNLTALAHVWGLDLLTPAT
jgi:hypothetical protein